MDEVRFLFGNQLVSALEELIRKAKHRLVLISPFIDLDTRIKDVLVITSYSIHYTKLYDTGSILFSAYAMEYFIAWYSGNPFEQGAFWNRAFGPMWWGGWTMIICNAFVSQLLWFRRVRTNLTAMFVIFV